MPQITIQQAFELALQHHGAGELREAEQLYQQILAHCPDHVDSVHNLGVLAFQLGRNDLAAVLLRRTIKLNPLLPEAHSNLGNALMRDGKVDQALIAYRRAIELRPDYAEALINLGVALKDKGETEEAISVYRRAVVLVPDHVEAHYNLALVLYEKLEIDAAIESYRRTLALRPNYAEAHNNLGVALARKGELDEAIAECRLATELDPKLTVAYYALGCIFKERGESEEAVVVYRQAAALSPGWAEVHNDLGEVLSKTGKFDEAIACFRQAISLKSDYADAYHNLGLAVQDQWRLDEAIAAYRKAILLKPDFAKAHNSLGSALGRAGNLDEAVEEYRLALSIDADFPLAHNNLGGAYRQKGQLDDAIACYRDALGINPNYTPAHSNLVFTLHFHPHRDAGTIAGEHQLWNQRFAEPLRSLFQPHGNDANPDRRLTIGYVSPDFRDHAVGRNLLPLFRQHDRANFRIVCYSNEAGADWVTDAFRQNSDKWCDIENLSDEKAAEQIRQDRVDILVDLALHTRNNRLLVFARKPAPVQVTFAGYPASTGLTSIDYRLSDPYLDRPGMDESVYSEQTIRLPDSFWCYDPLDCKNISVSSLPALNTGVLTFGCLNNFCKINDQILSVWAQVMRQVEGSRLLLLAKQGSHRQRTVDHLAQHGIDPARVEFFPLQSRMEYMKLYHRIDLGLDSFPYNGHTTSLDSFWMGVPVVTLVGQTAVSRAGLCQLTNLGLAELAAHTPGQFVQTAVELANDLPRLEKLRSTLRSRMEQSPLMDAPKFARSIEAAYRSMWEKWCKTAEDKT